MARRQRDARKGGGAAPGISSTSRVGLSDITKDIEYWSRDYVGVTYDMPAGGRVVPIRWGKSGGSVNDLANRAMGQSVIWSEAYPSGISSDNNASNLGSLTARDYVDRLYSMLLQRVQEAGRWVKFDSLQGGSTYNHPMNDWLGAYMLALSGVRLLEGCIAAISYNSVGEKVGQAAQSVRFRLEAARDMLQSVAMPYGLIELVDVYSGAFCYDNDSALYLIGGGGLTTQQGYNLTSTTDVASIMSNIEGAINHFFQGNPTLYTAGDAANLLNLFGNLYGSPRPFPRAKVHVGSKYLDSILTSMVSYSSTSTGNMFPTPVTYSSGFGDFQIPILARKGEQDPLRFSFARPQVACGWTNAATAGTFASEEYGIFQQLNGAPLPVTQYFMYYADGTAQGYSFQSSTTVASDFGCPLGWWGPVAGNGWGLMTIGDWSDDDFRVYDNWDLTWMTPSQLAVNHIAVLDRIFMQNGSPLTF